MDSHSVPSSETCDRFQMLTHVSSASALYDWTLNSWNSEIYDQYYEWNRNEKMIG